MNTFITRTLSAIVFLVIMVGCIWAHIYSYVLLFAVVNIGCLWEFISLSEKILPLNTFNPGKKIILISTGIVLTLIPLGLNSIGFVNIPYLLIAVVLLYTIIAFTVEMFSNPFNLLTVCMSLLGLVYISLPISFIIFYGWRTSIFDTHTHTALVTLALLVLVWTNDTMAYIIGSLIGKHTFLEHVSPKKTIEGTIGGIICTVIVAWAIHFYLINNNVPAFPWLLIGIAVSVLAIIGDLAESLLKRTAGVKDSGKIMPGHGGFLDRFDAMLMALPLVLLYLLIFI